MITQRQLVQVLKEFHKGLSDTTFRRYVYELLNVLSNEELQILIFNNVPPGIQIKAYEILEKRKTRRLEVMA